MSEYKFDKEDELRKCAADIMEVLTSACSVPEEFEVQVNLERRLRALVENVRLGDGPPLEMLLTCPKCGERHIDKGRFISKPHHTHACQHCGMVWRPAKIPTIGVQFLPGFKDDDRDSDDED